MHAVLESPESLFSDRDFLSPDRSQEEERREKDVRRSRTRVTGLFTKEQNVLFAFDSLKVEVAENEEGNQEKSA